MTTHQICPLLLALALCCTAVVRGHLYPAPAEPHHLGAVPHPVQGYQVVLGQLLAPGHAPPLAQHVVLPQPAKVVDPALFGHVLNPGHVHLSHQGPVLATGHAHDKLLVGHILSPGHLHLTHQAPVLSPGHDKVLVDRILAPVHAQHVVGGHGLPVKLLFTRFPPLVEGLVQRVQNYFSTYLHGPGYLPQDYPPEPSVATTTAATSTTTTIATTTTPTTTTTTTTPSPPPETSLRPVEYTTSNVAFPSDNVGSAGFVPSGYGVPPTSAFEDNEGRYNYDPPVRNPFRYPKPNFQRFRPKNYY